MKIINFKKENGEKYLKTYLIDDKQLWFSVGSAHLGQLHMKHLLVFKCSNLSMVLQRDLVQVAVIVSPTLIFLVLYIEILWSSSPNVCLKQSFTVTFAFSFVAYFMEIHLKFSSSSFASSFHFTVELTKLQITYVTMHQVILKTYQK